MAEPNEKDSSQEAKKVNGPNAPDARPTVGPRGGTGTPPKTDVKQVHADHAGVKKAREESEQFTTQAVKERKDARKKVSSGHLSGKWVLIGSALVSMENVAKIDLPSEGDANPTLTITHVGGGTTAVAGEDLKEFLEEFGLKSLPAKAGASRRADTVTETGRIISEAELKAEREAPPGRHNTTPNHSHRANAVLTNGETDFDVQERAGSAAVPTARNIPETQVAPGTEQWTETDKGQGKPGDAQEGQSETEGGETADETGEGTTGNPDAIPGAGVVKTGAEGQTGTATTTGAARDTGTLNPPPAPRGGNRGKATGGSKPRSGR